MNAPNMGKDPTLPIALSATVAEANRASRITSMARLPMFRQVLKLLVKIRTLETELKAIKAEQRKQWGWC